MIYRVMPQTELPKEIPAHLLSLTIVLSLTKLWKPPLLPILSKPLPRHLTLQMDNSMKDNKNQIVMAFCSDLVTRGVFETMVMSFLMVGHTHEDVDAFSKVAQ